MDETTDLTDWVIVEKYQLSKIRERTKGARVTKPYPEAQIWTVTIDDGHYLVVTWVPTHMGPSTQEST